MCGISWIVGRRVEWIGSHNTRLPRLRWPRRMPGCPWTETRMMLGRLWDLASVDWIRFMTRPRSCMSVGRIAVSYTHLRAHETDSYLVCRLLLEKKKQKK